jgi:tRNA threonylcarbamoyladenosine biosynthesis protein TsaE
VITVRTRSGAATVELGRAVAGLVRPGDVLLLIGGLGAGKTTFVQGLAGGLGYEGSVTSPTFTIRHTYAGRLDLVHVDLWRLERRDEFLDLGLEEDLEQGAVVAAEWGEGAETVFGPEALAVHLWLGAHEDEREIAFEARGPWAERAGALSALVGEVTV